MNILFVEPFGHREGHPSVMSRRFACAFADGGAEVTLVTFMGLRDDWAGRDQRIGHVSVFLRAGVVLRFYRLLNRYPLMRSVLRILETFITLGRALSMNRNRQYDVVFVLDAEPVFFACLSLALLCKNRSFVITVYSPPPCPAEWRSGFRRALGTLHPALLGDTLRYLVRTLVETEGAVSFRSTLYRKALRKNNTVFVCESSWIEKAYSTYLNGIFQDKFMWIPLGVEKPIPPLPRESARRALGLPQDKTVLLSFGNNHPGKNLETVFRALGDLDEDFLLIQAGKLMAADETGDPKRLAGRYGCTRKSIIDDRFIPEEEAMLYFFAADAVVLSYRRHFVQFAGILNEAAKYCTPVIASDVGQLGEFVNGRGLGITFVPESSSSLREAILSFQRLSEEERERIRANLRAYAADYSWEEMARKRLELFRRVAGA